MGNTPAAARLPAPRDKDPGQLLAVARPHTLAAAPQLTARKLRLGPAPRRDGRSARTPARPARPRPRARLPPVARARRRRHRPQQLRAGAPAPARAWRARSGHERRPARGPAARRPQGGAAACRSRPARRSAPPGRPRPGRPLPASRLRRPATRRRRRRHRGGRPMTVVLVTVAGPSGRRDLVVPADVPVGDLLGPVAAAVPGGERGEPGMARPERWRLELLGGDPLPPERSLTTCGVGDGATLTLTLDPPPATTQPPLAGSTTGASHGAPAPTRQAPGDRWSATPLGSGGAATPLGSGGAATPLGSGGAATPLGSGGAATPLGSGGAATPLGSG